MYHVHCCCSYTGFLQISVLKVLRLTFRYFVLVIVFFLAFWLIRTTTTEGKTRLQHVGGVGGFYKDAAAFHFIMYGFQNPNPSLDLYVEMFCWCAMIMMMILNNVCIPSRLLSPPPPLRLLLPNMTFVYNFFLDFLLKYGLLLPFAFSFRTLFVLLAGLTGVSGFSKTRPIILYI